jgi:hypothetical protein
VTDLDQSGTPTGVVGRVVGWLRAGYPTGVPEQDYVPLLGILRRSLTPEELEEVVENLVEDAEKADADGGSIGHQQLRARIEDLLLGPALPQDLVRVSARLASAGWHAADSSRASSVGSAPGTRRDSPSRTSCRSWRCSAVA